MGTSSTEPQEKGKTQEKGNITASTLAPKGNTVTSKQSEKPAASEKPAEPAKIQEKVSDDNLLITAKMETWIGLKIDGTIRKEILLKPGKTFSTRVDKFVELLIGNAGGIDITFNGKKVENIGKAGQVVRLRLPRKKSEETKKETPAP